MLKLGVCGDMNTKLLAGKTFVISGHFPRVDGWDPTAVGATKIKVMNLFEVRPIQGSQKGSMFSLWERFSTKEAHASKDRFLIVLTLCGLQRLLLGQQDPGSPATM